MNAPPSRLLQVILGAAAFVGCLAAVVFLILMIRPPAPAAVFLVGANYAGNLAVPHNVPGWRGLEGIKDVSKTPARWSLFHPAALQLVGKPDQALNPLENKGQWDGLMAELESESVAAPTLLIVVALHGGSRAEGPYLMPNGIAGPGDGLDLKQVIESMKTLPAGKNKILVLEGGGVSTAWRLGMVHNDFARQLKEMESEIENVPNLWVLSGCDVDQKCWASEALGTTIFTHYIIEALRGAAGGSDHRLSLQELYEYVSKNVRDWTWNARGALQEPQLLPASRGGGRIDPARVYLAASAAAPALATSPSLDPRGRAAIQEAWAAFHRLEAMVPPPSVYSPRRWREYRATLVRYEELLRAGAPGLAAELKEKRLGLLLGNLDDERFLKKSLVSAELNLVMNALRGGPVEPTPQSAAFGRFLNATDATAPGEWEALKSSLAGNTAADHARSPRIRVQELLVQYAAGELTNFTADDIAGSLSKAADRLNTIRGSQPLSAEAHFSRMLDKYIPALKERTQLWGAIRTSLVVRRRAERAALAVASAASGGYHYSEQIQPWIRASILTADAKRRRGEDLLFSSVESDWRDAKTALDDAKRDYDQAISNAGRIRGALEIRDRALAGLPDYSKWLPFYDPGDEKAQKPAADLAAVVRDLWDKTHKLAELLESEDGGDLARLEDIQRRADDIRKNFQALETRFQGHVANLESKRREKDWEAAVAAAGVAFPDNDKLKLRNELLLRLDGIRERDINFAKNILEGKSTIAAPDEQQADLALGEARRRAGLQAMMAISVLGERWFKSATDTSKAGEDEFKIASDRVRDLRGGNPGESWRKDAEILGELIGQQWRRMSDELGQSKRIADYAALRSRLVVLDRLGRQIDAGAKPLSDQTEWATRLRETRVHDALRWLADRTWEDHWFNEDPDDRTPYYQTAVSNMIADSKDQLAAFPDITDSKTDFDFNGRLALQLQGAEPIILTSEKSAPASYRVLENGRVPKQGIPVVKPLAGPGLQLDVAGGIADFRPASRQSDGPPSEFRFLSSIIKEAEEKQGKTDSNFTRPEVTPSKLTVTGFFRGQIFPAETPVEIHPVAGLVAIGPPPAERSGAGVAVKANGDVIKKFGLGTGSIAIVLDCSGSMKFNDGDVRMRNEKFNNAKNALTRVLNDVHQGTTVSIWTFSQLPPEIPSDADGVPQVDANDPHYLQLDADPEPTIQCLRKPSRWDPNQVAALRAQLDGLRPWFHTPLVAAMVRAADTDLKKDVPGMKTLLVLTDGKDDRFDRSPFLARLRGNLPDIPTFIAAHFQKRGITVNMVFLSINDQDPELKVARKDFAKTLENLTPPGRFVSATDLVQLTNTLRRALRQKLVYDILKPDGAIVQQGLDVSGEQQDDQLIWSSALKAGTYRLRVQTDGTSERTVELDEGDRLIVQLVDNQNGEIGFERGIYGDQPELGEPPRQEQKDWRLTVLSNQLVGETPTARFSSLTSLEPVRSPKTGPLRQTNPRLTWFELMADGNTSPAAYSVRWHEQITYPAPAWLLEVPRWINDRAAGGPARPILRAWWSAPESESDLPSLAVPLGNALEFQNNLPKAIRGEGDLVTIEGFDVEEHSVEPRPGAPVQKESCAVIRLGFPKGRPYIVDPAGFASLNTAGYEHRLYTQASKYTGLFWPVTPRQLSELKRLSLISIAGFQKRAKTAGFSVAELKLPAPDVQPVDKTPTSIELQQ